MRIVKNLFLVSFLVSFVAYSSVFATDLETETKNDKKSGKKFYKLHKLHKNHGSETEAKNDKKLYDFTKNSGLEGVDLKKAPTLKAIKKATKSFTNNSLKTISLKG